MKEEVMIYISCQEVSTSIFFLRLVLIVRAMHVEMCSGLIQMISSACNCLPTLLYSLFKCGEM